MPPNTKQRSLSCHAGRDADILTWAAGRGSSSPRMARSTERIARIREKRSESAGSHESPRETPAFSTRTHPMSLIRSIACRVTISLRPVMDATRRRPTGPSRSTYKIRRRSASSGIGSSCVGCAMATYSLPRHERVFGRPLPRWSRSLPRSALRGHADRPIARHQEASGIQDAIKSASNARRSFPVSSQSDRDSDRPPSTDVRTQQSFTTCGPYTSSR